MSKHNASHPQEVSTNAVEAPASASRISEPPVSQPLSILTANSDIPLRDLKSWIVRPASQRVREVSKNSNSHTVRPCCNFRLYALAYADRIKQLVANTKLKCNPGKTISAASWKLEPPSVKREYTKLAKLEKIRHAQAFPKYNYEQARKGSGGAVEEMKKRNETMSKYMKRSRPKKKLTALDDDDDVAMA